MSSLDSMLVGVLPVSDQIQSSDCCLLGVPSYVTADERQQGYEWSWRCLGQIVACETTAVVAERQTDNQTHADDSDDETGSADEEAVLVAIAEQSTGD